jgi:uncharacterized protein (TIGR02284 family)
METIEKTVEVLNDLIEINNDRIAGFTHAADDMGDGDPDLKVIFAGFKSESESYVGELSAAVNQLGGETEMGTSASGTIHRAWIDVKATFSGHDRKSVLTECERGEDAIKKAYRDALNAENGLSADLVQLISRQQEGITAAHNRIKTLRDSQ